MTARQVYEGVLIEMNKVQAPSLLLEDFNYLFNKAINQYINKKYNIYDISQQTTDDLRVLKSSCVLSANQSSFVSDVTVKNSMWGAIYEFELPQDYLHLLNCICNYRVAKPFKCYNAGTYVQFPATRLTADLWSQVINNFYMRPMYKRPYYYINNINHTKVTDSDDTVIAGGPSKYGQHTTLPSSQVGLATDKSSDGGIDISTVGTVAGVQTKDVNGSGALNYADGTNSGMTGGISRKINIDGTDFSQVERVGQVRYGNPSSVRLEIRYGKDDSLFQLDSVYVDYIKAPQHIRITQEQLDLTEDTSQIMEFPDYVCQEIINELVHIVMENSSDPRLQSHIPVSQSIANPAQAQEPAQQQRA